MLIEEGKKEEEDTRLPSSKNQLMSDLASRYYSWEEEKERLIKFYQG